MLKKFRRLMENIAPKATKGFILDKEILDSANRFSQWLSDREGKPVKSEPQFVPMADRLLDELKSELGPTNKLPDAMASDAAAYIGDVVRKKWHSGTWFEDEMEGIVLLEAGKISWAKFNPLALIEQKWSKGPAYKLDDFLNTMEGRFASERELQPMQSNRDFLKEISGRSGIDADTIAADHAREFQVYWKSRFKRELPLSLAGVKELNGYLISNFVLSFLGESELVTAGFYLGEVGRGLFQGSWDFTNVPFIQRAALKYPELNYYPIGRIYKLMSEKTESESLDEYLRLIPSARSELRRQSE